MPISARSGAADVLAVQGFRPDHDRLAARGVDVRPELEGQDGFGAALVQIVKSKAGRLSAVAEAIGRGRARRA
jgi:16S rRNA (guanine1207-N2)-methyltransferase